MRAINCRALKVRRIYISQGTFLPLFPYVRYSFQTRHASLEFVRAIAPSRALSEISKSTSGQTIEINVGTTFWTIY